MFKLVYVENSGQFEWIFDSELPVLIAQALQQLSEEELKKYVKR